MSARPRTTMLRRLTLESGDHEDVAQSTVSGSVVETLTPALQRALDGEPMVGIPPTGYWFTAREEPDEALRVEIGTQSLRSRPIVEMTLRPPNEEGTAAILMTSIGGWLQAMAEGAIGDRPTGDRIANDISDIEKCIAWTWLELRGYATRRHNLGSPLEVLFSAGGGMLTAVVQEPGQSAEVCFLVQNEPHAVRRLPEIPSIAVHARLFKVGDVHLVPLVARIGDTWYESWINACSDDGRGKDELEILAAQERLVFLVYDGTSLDPERTVQLANPLKDSMSQIHRVMRDVVPWTMDEFADAREELYAAYPTSQELISGPDLTST